MKKPAVSLDIIVLCISLFVTYLAWRVTYIFPQEQIPLYVFIIGVTASFFLFGMVFFLTRAQLKSQELDIERARLLAAIDIIPIGIAITDINGNIVLSNFGLSEVLGEVGVTWTLQSMNDRLSVAIDLVDSYKTALEERRTVSWKKVNFEGRKLDIYLSPIYSSEEKGVFGVLICITDVTRA